MRRFLLAITLASFAFTPALAGDIPISDAPAPPPHGMTADGRSLAGEIPSAGFADQVSNEALSALLTALTSVMV